MKKLFTLLAMVGLAVASCTPTGNEPGNNGGNEGAGEFAITVSEITATSAHIKVEAKEASRTFYANLTSKAEFANAASPAAFMNAHHAMLKEAVDEGQVTWAELIDAGTAEWTKSKVKPNGEYVAYAYGLDANGNLTSAEPSYKSFKTLESTFDTASWAGWWEVTSPMTYVQQTNILTEKYEEDWTNDELTRKIQLVDGASLDESMAGYAVVYGWDGFFLLDGPAIGVYNDNKIELLNEEIVYENTSNGSVYQWLAQSALPTYDPENMYMVGGEYPPYTFAMDADGKVTIEPYVGQITTGDQFIVCAFNIFPVVGEDIYTWIYEEPAYTFSGQGITADKTTAPEDLEPAKKSVKAMHKMANQKFVTKTFTAARFVK